MMKRTARSLRWLFAASSLLVLGSGCSSRAVVGVDDEPPPGGLCEGTCPSPMYADAIDAGWSEILDMAPAPDGGMVIVGRFAGTLQLPGLNLQQSSYSGNDEFVMKRAANGSIEWVRQIKTNTPSLQVAVRPGGEIVLAGSFQDTGDFGTGPYTASGGNTRGEVAYDFFTQTLLADGTQLAPRVRSTDLHVHGLALAPNGDLLLAAAVERPTSLDGIALAPQGMWDGVLVRITPEDDVVYARPIGAPGGDTLWDIVALPDGGAVVAGSHEQAFSYDGLSISAPGGHGHTFLLAVDAAGDAVWGDRIDPTPDDASDAEDAWAPSLRAAPDGNLVVLFNSGQDDPWVRDIALQTFAVDGTRLGHVELGTFQAVTDPIVEVAPDGDVFVAGGLRDTLEIAGVEIEGSPNGDLDGFLSRVSAAGELRWVRTFGAPGSRQTALRLAVTSAGVPVVGGDYRDSFSIGEYDLPLAEHNPLAFVAAFAP